MESGKPEKEPCVESCVLGDMGHCGRTDHERMSHCEKRFYAGLPQLSNLDRRADDEWHRWRSGETMTETEKAYYRKGGVR